MLQEDGLSWSPDLRALVRCAVDCVAYLCDIPFKRPQVLTL